MDNVSVQTRTNTLTLVPTPTPTFTPQVLDDLRELTPLVQCITNTVVQQIAANVLLAAGASPAMVDHEADSAGFASMVHGLSLNFGTPTSHRYLAMDAAIQQRQKDGNTWVLDPVGLGVGPFRNGRIHRTLAERPTVIRGNASEIAALAGMGAGARGIEAVDQVDAVIPAAQKLSTEYGSVVAISGPTDAIVTTIDGTTHVTRVTGGSTFMPLVVGTGCSLGALVAGYVGTAHSGLHDQVGTTSALVKYHEATVVAHAHFAQAGTQAEFFSDGPGTFHAHFLDQLYAVGSSELEAVTVETEQL